MAIHSLINKTSEKPQLTHHTMHQFFLCLQEEKKHAFFNIYLEGTKVVHRFSCSECRLDLNEIYEHAGTSLSETANKLLQFLFTP